MATIRTPEPGYTGPGVAGLTFVDGVATSTDPAVIAYCRGAGYGIDGSPTIGVGSMTQSVRAQAAQPVDATAREGAMRPTRVGGHARDAADPNRDFVVPVVRVNPYPERFSDVDEGEEMTGTFTTGTT